MEKTADAFRTISEVADDLDLPQHVLRFWETRFVQIKPLKRGGGRRYYRREDIDLLRAIRQLLYSEGYTIKGVQKILKEQGARGVIAAWRGEGERAPATMSETDADLYDTAPTMASSLNGDAAGHDSDPLEEERAPQSSGPSSFARANYAVLHQLLAEIGECERLLGAARAG